MDFQNLCLGCMHELPPGAEVCPNCSKNTREPQHSPLLEKRFILDERYLIGLCLSSSPDSVIYSGLDLKNGRRVSICEFLPKNLIVRGEGESRVRIRVGYDSMYSACIQSFASLWKTLGSLNGTPALPIIKEVFSANSTAYAVFETVECISLEEYFKSSKKKLDWPRIKTVFKPVLEALKALNSRKIVHAAVSPSTVLVGADGRLHLSGFSIPQTKSDVIELRAPSAAGYSPLELSDRRLKLGAYTDVYSVMAVMYTALTGLKPQNAADRAVNDMMVIPYQIAKDLDKASIAIILSALQIYPESRIKSVDELYSLLYRPSVRPEEVSPAQNLQKPQPVPPKQADKPKAEEKSALPPKPEEEKPSKNKKSPREESGGALTFKIVAAALLIAAMVFVTAYSTVLYKYFDIPFLNNALSAMTFLPINGETHESTTKPKETKSETETASSTESAKNVVVANFTQLTYRDILNNETFNKNFKIEFTFEPSNDVEKNSIISQSIAAGESVPQGTQITIVVSSGKPYVVLRDVMGMKYEQAYELLTEDGFKVQKVLIKNNGTRVAGTVSTMSLVAGLEFEKGTTVTLSVWDEPSTKVND